MKQRMKILNQNILSSGNYREMALGISYFAFFIGEIFTWYNFQEEELSRYSLTITVMFILSWLKHRFITEVTIPDKGSQNIASGLAIFPVSKKEILWSHFKSVLATQTILTVLLFVLFLLMKKELIWLDFVWALFLPVIPLFTVGIRDRKLLVRE